MSVLTGCSAVEADVDVYAVNTPPAMQLPLHQVQEMNYPAAVPDSVNLVGYIVGAYICPANAFCNYADEIYLAADPSSDKSDAIRVWPGHRQFEYIEGRRYLFSVRYRDDFRQDTVYRRFSLIGMTDLEYPRPRF